ncbi:hypothetical protein [Haloarchaeobius sp. DT45]|uniref:hypothetical protein n=1 Tax=Haloarchaeobius sp. DT45 TaxID=3446116 RepID=UPI003F6ABB75
MALPNTRVAPEEVLASSAADTPEKVIALAECDDDQRPEPIGSDVFEAFVTETVDDDPSRREPEAPDDVQDLDLDELFR